MELEDGPDDDGRYPFVPVPPPDDRLWRHPSELAGADMGVTSLGGGRGGRGLLGVTVVATVAASALLVTGLLAATVGLGSSLKDRAPGVTVSTASTSAAVAFTGDRMGRGLATVAVVTDAGRRTGAAVSLDREGRLATAAPLVRDARSLTVTLADGTRHRAAVAGVDTESGVAVLSTDEPSAGAARWASATRLRPGDAVRLRDRLAGTATLDATILNLGAEATTATGERYDHLLMLDTPAWSVAEGAAVVDADGRVLAIALLDAAGLVYAVPIDIAHGAATSLTTNGTVRAALLDVVGDPLPSADAEAIGVDGGARINDIDPHGPAAAGGLRVGDVIVAVDGAPVLSFDCLVIVIRAHQPGDALEITYWRAGQEATTTVTLGERALKG